jgi:hypothetical protein
MISVGFRILSLSLAFAPLAAFGAFPLEWIQGSREQLEKALAFQRSSARSEGARDLDRYLEASETFAASRPKTTGKPWYLQSIKTELGVAASGEIGFLGVEGEAAVELIWTRRKEAVARLVEEARGNREAAEPTRLFAPAPLAGLEDTEAAEPVLGERAFRSDLGEAALSREVEELSSGLAREHQIRDRGRLRAELKREVSRMQPILAAFAGAPQEWNWVPYKLQQELFLQASGAVSPLVKVGAITRVRIEWAIVRRPVTSGASARFTPWLRALDQALVREEAASPKAFKLAAFKVGVGLGAELELGVAELKGHAVASVFFKRVPAPRPLPLLLAEESLPVLDAEGRTESRLTSGALQVALTRAIGIGGAVTDRAAAYERKRVGKEREFELGAVEVELELTTEHELLLPTVMEKAAAELFYVKGGLL